METNELINHCRDNIANGRPAGYGLTRNGNPCNVHRLDNINFQRPEQYKLAQRTSTLNGFQVPEPVWSPLNDGNVSYAGNTLNGSLFLQNTW